MTNSEALTAEISFSVVVPYYNRSSCLARLMEGIRQQTVKPREVFIVDNGSHFEDILQAQQVLEQYRDSLNLILLSSMERGNANFARNAGTLLSSSSHVAYLDSDDWWESRHLESAALLLKECHPDTSVYSAYNIRRESGAHRFQNRPFKEGETALEFLFSLGRGYAQSSGLIVPTSIAQKVLWAHGLRRNQDYDFFLRVSSHSTWTLKKECTVNIDWTQDQGKPIDYKSVLSFYDSSIATSSRQRQKLIFLAFSIKESTIRLNGAEYFPQLLARLRSVSFPLYGLFAILGYRGTAIAFGFWPSLKKARQLLKANAQS